MSLKGRTLIAAFGLISLGIGLVTALMLAGQSGLQVGGWFDVTWIAFSLAAGVWLVRRPDQAPFFVGLAFVQAVLALEQVGSPPSVTPIVCALWGLFMVMAAVRLRPATGHA